MYYYCIHYHSCTFYINYCIDDIDDDDDYYDDDDDDDDDDDNDDDDYSQHFSTFKRGFPIQRFLGLSDKLHSVIVEAIEPVIHIVAPYFDSRSSASF